MKLFLLLLQISFLQAGWCVWYSSQKRIYTKEDRRFFALVQPSIIAKHNGWYRFLSGPYKNKQAALRAKRKAAKLFPNAFIYRCKKLQAKDVMTHFE